MKTGTIIAIIVGVVVLGAGAFVLTKQSGAPQEVGGGEERAERTSAEERELGGVGSLKSLFGRGENLTCTITHSPEEGGEFSGTVYLSGEDMRGDFTVSMDGQTMESHMIQDGEYGYSWGTSPFGTMAFKYKLSADSDVAEGNASSDDGSWETSRESFDVDQEVEYSCEPWRVDRSKFVPPSDVTFTDMEAQMETMSTQEESFNIGSGNQCAVCDQAPDATSKAQCRAALGCNE